VTHSCGTSPSWAKRRPSCRPRRRPRFPGIPWRNPARLRNRVVHGYWSVDVGILHTTASEQLGEFTDQLREAEALLAADEPDSAS
jgi:uncharacterized protein with HEPN domain